MTTPEPAEKPTDEEPVLSHSLPYRSEVALRLARLYREEIVEAARIIRDECGHVEIDFHDDRRTRGASPEAFAAFANTDVGPERLERLTISGRRGTTALSLDITRVEASVVLEEPTNSTRWAAEQLRRLCSPKRGFLRGSMPWKRRLIRRMSIFVLIALAIPLVFGIVLIQLVGGFMFVVTYLLFTVVFCVMLIAWQGTRYLLVSPNVVINAPRAERPTWWERHRKDVLLTLVSGTIGGVIGYFVNQLPPL
ncbi:hypothetical protein LP52_24990 [Streptomonospora alba]|uniref:Uncharacterized protein n=1 Tax=Streptomonospora alba TaxID=183763 RepID=A0A0C2JBR0_9ACTN|nr:hypothetical protein [Streptomonospora alba]KIH96435.1 hypothetical protein LP52_24990 [Streptomonospora alba]